MLAEMPATFVLPQRPRRSCIQWRSLGKAHGLRFFPAFLPLPHVHLAVVLWCGARKYSLHETTRSEANLAARAAAKAPHNGEGTWRAYQSGSRCHASAVFD